MREVIRMSKKKNSNQREYLNPYLDEFMAMGDQDEYWRMSIDQMMAKKDRSLNPITLRGNMCKKYAWSIPTNNLALAIKQYLPDPQKIIEIGAGTGYFAWFLSQYQIDIICFDTKPYNNNYCQNKWFEVNEGGAELSKNYTDRALMLCWPPYNEPMAYEALKNYGGEYLIYIGEGSWGCTGDGNFHYLLDIEWDELWSEYPPNWMGIHSYDNIYKRKRVT